MRDDGHMQGGGCHDRRRRGHTGRRRDSTDGHRECPSSRAFAIRRENGGRDFRMLPAALAAWMASAAAHQWWRWLTLMDDDPMSVTGYAIGALAVMLLPVVLVVPSLASHGLIRPLRASLGDAVAVMAVAGLLSAAAAVTADSVRWHDAAHVQARDGPADVVAVVRVRSPAVSSTVRGSDCQVDGRVVSLSIRRSPANPLSERSTVPSRADIRVLLSGDVCSALTDTAVYRFPGTLSTASYGRQPLWLTCDDMRVPDVVSAPSGTARIVKAMQQGLLRACDRLSDQARVLVPGLTVGVLGQDVVRVRDTASGAASHGSEEGLSSGTERVGGVDAAYAALLEEQFRRSGIMHLMAVSGGHFMVIAGLVHRLCSRVLAPRWATGLVMAVSDVMLAIVVFPSDSVLRALLMGLFGAAAVAAGRRGQSVSSLSWTVIIVLLIAPSMSVSYGFALSCAAVLGIVLFAGPLTDWLACMLPRLLSAPLAMTIAAQSLTLPIQVLMDPQLPLASVPANLLVGPVVGFATMAGLVALFISWLMPQCGYVLAWIAGCGTSVMERVAAMVSDNEFATMPWAGGIPGALLMVLVESACATVLILATRWLRLLRSDGSGDGGQSFRPRLRDRIRIWWSQTVTMFDGDTDGGDRPVPHTKVTAGAIPVASMTGAHDGSCPAVWEDGDHGKQGRLASPVHHRVRR